MTADLDSRARAAATSLHNALADRPLPTDVAPRSTGWTRTVLTAAAVVVAVAALATALLWPDGDDGKSGLATTSGEVPRLVPTYVPDGFELAGAAETPVGETGSIWVYGDSDSPDAPFAQRDLAVFVFDRADGIDETTLVPAGQVTAAALNRGPEQLHTSVSVDLGDGSIASISSRTLPDEEIVAVANQVRGGPTLPTDLPEGLSMLVSEAGIGPGMWPLQPVADGYFISYEVRRTDQENVLVVASSDLDPLIARYYLGPDADEVSVRGATGWLADQAAGSESSALVWQEQDRVMSVAALDLSRDELLRVAESLEPVDDATWASLLEESNSVTVDRSAAVSGGRRAQRRWHLVGLRGRR